MASQPRHAARKLAAVASDFDTPSVSALLREQSIRSPPAKRESSGIALLAGLPLCFLFAVSKPLSLVKYWLPVIACMALIFFGSSDTLSMQHTSRILGPLIHWLLPGLSEERIVQIVVTIRKCGHLTEFGLLALLIWRALLKPTRHQPTPWRWADARLVFLLTVLYAASDELHQCFVPSREGAVRDVLVDAAGALAALLLLWALGRWRKKW